MRVRWSPEALQDARRLWAFLDERSPSAARRLMARIAAATDRLAELPGSGRRIGEDVRRLVVPFGGAAYIVHYRVASDEVLVARVWHARERR